MESPGASDPCRSPPRRQPDRKNGGTGQGSCTDQAVLAALQVTITLVRQHDVKRSFLKRK